MPPTWPLQPCRANQEEARHTATNVEGVAVPPPPALIDSEPMKAVGRQQAAAAEDHAAPVACRKAAYPGSAVCRDGVGGLPGWRTDGPGVGRRQRVSRVR